VKILIEAENPMKIQDIKPVNPVTPHLMRYAYGIDKALHGSVGGALEFARSIEKRYNRFVRRMGKSYW
jgi:hypothetical protein